MIYIKAIWNIEVPAVFKSVFVLFKPPFLNFHITSCIEGASKSVHA